ncbi:hypothetical protein LPJ79_000281 [Coemansia sp. RSA 1821]|nr:hypothetical protein BX667DRAFT_496820 [Coemansia mojavensis]KAJ1744456.1 hypothetical protein LPJ68_000136 [Coemansia sp. RSA 1086]KAJ1753688.1 hypothetical protein LPJ79_000281 [Coemansia sp. RSA 1821]
MATIDSLPSDIIDAILRQVINPVVRTPGDWALLLKYLGICPSWRAVAKHFVCSTGIIELSQEFEVKSALSTFDDISHTTVPFTNLRLIQQGGWQTSVCKLIIYDRRTTNTSPSSAILSMIAISLSLEECPGIAILRKFYDTIQMRQRITPSLRSECCEAIEQIISSLINTYPYVMSLKYDVQLALSTQKQLYTGVLDGYAKQLKSFVSYVPELALDFSTATQLTVLDLDISGGLAGQLPSIYPQSLQKLTLRAGQIYPYWGLFYSDKTDTLRFDNLKSLTLCGTQKYAYIDEQISYGCHNITMGNIEMPQLQTLRIQDVFMTRSSIRQLLRSPLTSVQYCGPPAGAILLDKQCENELDELVFEFKPDLQNDFASFCAHTNRLFRTQSRSKNVYCSLDNTFGEFSYTNLSWKYVTHIELQTVQSYQNIIPLFGAFPNLVYLMICCPCCNLSEEKEEIIWLESIKSEEIPPVSSKVEELVLIFEDYVPTKEFTEAVQNLKLYLPKLKSIDI